MPRSPAWTPDYATGSQRGRVRGSPEALPEGVREAVATLPTAPPWIPRTEDVKAAASPDFRSSRIAFVQVIPERSGAVSRAFGGLFWARARTCWRG